MNFSGLLDLLLVVFGFSMLVVIHEFGHFAAARWAGVRVYAFAVGFGPALISFRKGLGVRAGSSEREYVSRVDSKSDLGVSATEYRLNLLPFGGYVRMKGQDDMDPGAVSDDADSYQRCLPWKRMIIISAGVIMNLITAVLMFIFVFMTGLRIDAPVIGFVALGSPAAEAGVQTGDRVIRIDGDRANSFNDIAVAAALASKGESVRFEIERPGESATRSFDLVPASLAEGEMPTIGVTPAAGSRVLEAKSPADREAIVDMLTSLGLDQVTPGMRLIGAGTFTVGEYADIIHDACRDSDGASVQLRFIDDTTNTHVTEEIEPVAELCFGESRPDRHTRIAVAHIAGIVPVMKVGPLEQSAAGYKSGIRSGDIFARIGDVQFPSMVRGVSEIRSKRSQTVEVDVLRTTDDGSRQRIALGAIPVDSAGRIGISIEPAVREVAIAAETPPEFVDRTGNPIIAANDGPFGREPMLILRVNGEEVHDLIAVRRELKSLVATGATEAKLTLRSASDETATAVEYTLTITPESARELARIGWASPFGTAIFERAQTTLKANDVLDAIRMGFAEAHRAMMQVYITFARLFEGTVQVQDLKGPVGIAHIGTLVAGKGMIWLVFFFALISVNLAVVNFLPLPIVDGGQFLLIVYEKLRGKPAPLGFQNAMAIAGLVLIGSLFLFITFHDIRNLFGLP